MVWALLSESVKRVRVSCICIQDILSQIWRKTNTIAFLRFLNLDIHQVFNKLWSPVLTQYYGSTLHTSYIRKEKYRPATTPAAAAAAPMYVTFRGPLLYSEMGWTGELWSKTNLLNWQNIFISLREKKKIFMRLFQIFFLMIRLDCRALSNCLFLILENKKDFFLLKKIFFFNFCIFFKSDFL